MRKSIPFIFFLISSLLFFLGSTALAGLLGPAEVPYNDPVGIGIARPQFMLQVVSSIPGKHAAAFTNTDGIGVGIGGIPEFAFGSIQAFNNNLKDKNKYIHLFLNKFGGNVVVGDPWSDQHNSLLDVFGAVTADGFNTRSDLRLKKNITTIESALDIVSALRGVEFEWQANIPEERLNGKNIGLIAQEVESVLPEVVSTDDQGYKSIAYGNLVAVLIEAVKGLKEQNEELRIRIEALEGR